MSDFKSSGIKGILDYGIDLKLDSEEMESYYVTRMCEYYNENSNFKAYLSGEKSFEVEVDRQTPIMEITIDNSMLSIFPYSEDVFEAFAIMLEFIAKKHLEIVSEFQQEEVSRIESPDKVNSEEDSDDDYEWI